MSETDESNSVLEIGESFRTPNSKNGSGKSDSKEDNLFSKTMEGFTKEDIKSPSIGINIDKKTELEILPSENIEEYMVKWTNRFKQDEQGKTS